MGSPSAHGAREPRPDSGCCLRPSAESPLLSLPDLRTKALEPGGRMVTIGPRERSVTDFGEAAWRGVGFQSQELPHHVVSLAGLRFGLAPGTVHLSQGCEISPPLNQLKGTPMVLCMGRSWRPAVPAALRGRPCVLSSSGCPWAQLDARCACCLWPWPWGPMVWRAELPAPCKAQAQWPGSNHRGDELRP